MRPVQHDDLNDLLEDPFNAPSMSSVPFNFGRSTDVDGSSLYIYPGNLDITKVRLEYLKQPQKMSIGGYTYLDGTASVRTECEMPNHVKREIVDRAVALAKAYAEDPNGYPLALAKLTNNE